MPQLSLTIPSKLRKQIPNWDLALILALHASRFTNCIPSQRKVQNGYQHVTLDTIQQYAMDLAYPLSHALFRRGSVYGVARWVLGWFFVPSVSFCDVFIPDFPSMDSNSACIVLGHLDIILGQVRETRSLCSKISGGSYKHRRGVKGDLKGNQPQWSSPPIRYYPAQCSATIHTHVFVSPRPRACSRGETN